MMEINLCPNCSSWLEIRKKACQKCGLQLEADFDENALVTLAREEQDFILEFVLCGGSFKALAEKLGATYPTLRSHLNRIITKLKTISGSLSASEILHALDNDRVSQYGGSCRAVAGDVISLGGSFFEQLRTHILKWIFQLDLLGNGDAVVGDRRGTEFLVQSHIAALGAKSGSYSHCQRFHTF